MQAKIPIILAILALILVGCLGSADTQKISVATLNPQLIKALVTIDDGIFPISNNVEIKKGASALDAFEKVATLSARKYPFGSYIYSVNGKMENSGNDGKYWQYYVDGKIAMVAVDNYKLDNDVALDFRYEKQNSQIK